MKKLFIADPALSSHQGHHFSVTSCFSKFAEERCCDVIWLVNKNFQKTARDLGRGYRVELAFSVGTYDAYKKETPKLLDIGVNSKPTTLKARVKNRLKHEVRKLPEPVKVKIRVSIEHVRATMLKVKQANKTPQTIVQEQEKKDDKPVEKLTAAEELHQAIAKYSTTPDDIILFHTCDAHTYADIVELFTKTVELTKWNELPVIHLSTPYDDLVMPHNKTGISCDHSVRHLHALGVIGSRVYMHAENELLAEYLQKLWSVDVSPLYIPQQAVSVQNIENDKLNIVYLGAARTEKGFPMVSKAVRKFLQQDQRTDVHFILQVSPQIMGYTGDIEYEVKLLNSIEDERLHLIDTVQSPEQYEETLAKSNVLLLCYDKARYAVRSSGVVMEALANAKNVIATKGTFLEFIAAEAGMGVESVEGVMTAITNFADQRVKYRQMAEERRKVYLNHISPKSFLNLLVNTEYNRPFDDRSVVSTPSESRQAHRMRYEQLI